MENKEKGVTFDETVVDKEEAEKKADNDTENAEEDEEDEEDEPKFQITPEQRKSLKLSKETFRALKDVFRDLDVDDSGTLDSSELGQAFRSVNIECTEAELEQLIKQVDKDGNGMLDFYEFARMVSEKLQEYDPEKDLREAFAVFDVNGDGCISRDEIKMVVEQFGDKISNEDLESMLREADDNSDGYLDYEEFVKIWMGDDTLEAECKGPDTKENKVQDSQDVENTAS